MGKPVGEIAVGAVVQPRLLRGKGRDHLAIHLAVEKIAGGAEDLHVEQGFDKEQPDHQQKRRDDAGARQRAA